MELLTHNIGIRALLDKGRCPQMRGMRRIGNGSGGLVIILTKSKGEGLGAGIEEFDLKCMVSHRAGLANQLVEALS